MQGWGSADREGLCNLPKLGGVGRLHSAAALHVAGNSSLGPNLEARGEDTLRTPGRAAMIMYGSKQLRLVLF